MPASTGREPALKRYFAYFILAAMALGILVGFILNHTLSPAGAKEAAGNLSIVTDVFPAADPHGDRAPDPVDPWWPASPTWRTPPPLGGWGSRASAGSSARPWCRW